MVSELSGEGFGKYWKGFLNGSEPVCIFEFQRDHRQYLADRTLAMLRNEVSVWAPLRHHNIVAFLAYCDDPPMIATELHDGNLLDAIDKERYQAWRYLLDAANGLAFLHARSIRHGDIKSTNILICGKTAKISGFCLAQLMDDDSYHKNQRGGTPPFMAPELWSSDGPIGLPADVYTFAMTCWQVASDGDYPFTDLMLWELSSMEKFVGDGGRPDRPEDLRDDLRALMQRMWAQDPEDRPVMAEVVRELNRILRSWPETSY